MFGGRRSAWNPPDISTEVKEELRFYLEMRADEFAQQGMSAEDAWNAAVAAFGDPDRIEQEVLKMAKANSGRRTRRAVMASGLQDARFALRGLARDRGFAVVALLTLALGIGANSAIFSVARAALLRVPPVNDPEDVVAVYTTSRRGFPRSSSSYPDFLDYRDRTVHLEDLAATSLNRASLGSRGRGARLVTIQTVSGGYFGLLGVSPLLGRTIQPDDDIRGAGSAVVVLSHAFWMDHFAGDQGIVGSTVRLNGTSFDVVGVAAPGYRGLRTAVAIDLWLPLQSAAYLGVGFVATERAFEARSARWIDLLVGRLAPGSTVEQSRQELLALSERLREEDPQARGPRSVTVDPLRSYIPPSGNEGQFQGFLVLLAGVVLFALMLTCTNLANLLLARSSARQKEVGVRLALGAGRGRLVRQLMTESVILAALGGVAGLVVAQLLVAVLGRFELPGGVPVASLGVSLDAGMLALTAVLALATGVAFGLLPALSATRPAIVTSLKDSSMRSGRTVGTRTRTTLVGIQVAVSLVLLVGSGLFLRTLQEGFSTELGFRPDGVALTRYDMPALRYPAADAVDFVQRLERRVAALPGVDEVGTATRVPLGAGGAMGTFVEIDGYQPRPDEELRVDLVFVTPGFLPSLRLPLRSGRGINPSDTGSDEYVALVNEGMARRYWPDGEAVSGVLRFGEDRVRVVGVARNTTWNGLADRNTNYVYLPLAQSPERAAGSSLIIAARSAGDPAALLPAVRAEIAALEPDMSLFYQRTMRDAVRDVLMPQRLGALLFTAFGLLAVLLSGLGVTGVVAYAVNRQRRDIGVRVALGASRPSVVVGAMRGMVLPVVGGLAAGAWAARMLAPAVQDFMFGISAHDLPTYAVLGAVLAAVAFGAAYVPARNAARVDPVQVLKGE